MNVRLDPLERCAPHRIVVPPVGDDEVRGEIVSAIDDDGGGDIGRRGGESGGQCRRSATWNAIAALSTLCEEVQEIDAAFRERVLPSLVLFSAMDAVDLDPAERKDELDEGARERRESELLSRVGRSLSALQAASNGCERLRRLIRNMVVQLGAVQTPSAVPYYYDEDGERRGRRRRRRRWNRAGGRVERRRRRRRRRPWQRRFRRGRRRDAERRGSARRAPPSRAGGGEGGGGQRAASDIRTGRACRCSDWGGRYPSRCAC